MSSKAASFSLSDTEPAFKELSSAAIDAPRAFLDGLNSLPFDCVINVKLLLLEMP